MTLYRVNVVKKYTVFVTVENADEARKAALAKVEDPEKARLHLVKTAAKLTHIENQDFIEIQRESAIKKLIQDRLDDWVHASNTDGLEDLLRTGGWTAYENMTNAQLASALMETPEYATDPVLVKVVGGEE